jgi:hypothetical protein
MSTSVPISVIVLCFTTAAGWGVIAYSGFAGPRGLPVGALLAEQYSWLQGLAYLVLLGSIAATFSVGSWWLPLLVIISANLIVRLLFRAAGPTSQYICAIGAVLAIPSIAVIVYVV